MYIEEDIHTKKMSFLVKDNVDITILVSEVEKKHLLKGASHVDSSLVKTILSELCTNIVKYAKRGSVSIERIDTKDEVMLEITVTDNGPGIVNLDLALQDKFSTGGTLGLGLPGVRRMADKFEIFSSKENGTIVKVLKKIKSKQINRNQSGFSIIEKKENFQITQHLQTNDLDIASFVRPFPGEISCGDKISVITMPTSILLCITDVSGHGDVASKLADEIEKYLAENASSNLESLITNLHNQFKGSRGAAMGFLHIDMTNWLMSYCGVGNTGASLISSTHWRLISKEGVVGLRLPSLNIQTATLSQGDLFFMWTDGLPELASRNFVTKSKSSTSIRIAHDVINTLGRPTDDAGCLILRRI